jgi:glycine betaine/choline ABC-type transport system substrate-binding protein
LRAALGGIGVAALVAATLVPSMARSPSSYIVGAKTFAEQYVLSALIAQRLRAAGLSATSREGLGSNVIFDALVSDDIDVYVDYSGTLWANQFHRTEIKPRGELLGELKAMLAQQKVTLLGELGFENAYALVMPRKRAEALGIRSIADLASHAKTMSMAADYEFFSRPEWAGLREAYGLSFRAQRQMQPDFMYAAVASGEVDVIAGYTSDGLIAKYDLVVLEDPKHAIPPYDAIVLSALPIGHCGRRCNRCSAGSTYPRCVRPICAPPAATAPRRRMRWRAGCGRRSGRGKATRTVASATGPPFQRRFLVGLCGAGAAFAGAGCSGSMALPTVAISIRWLAAAAGRPASINCSSPRPIACRRFDEILNVFANTSRITSARRWLSVRLLSRLPAETVLTTIRNLYASNFGSLSTSAIRPSV